jgi:REP element-mobilizing transposase RayT
MLKSDKYKMLIINILKGLVGEKLIAVSRFVVKPNHLILIWDILDKNGK